MNEGTGSVVGDSSGNGYDFSPVGSGIGAGYSWGAGYENGGLTAAAGNDSYLHATIASNKFQYQVTAEAWIKPTAADTDGSQIIDLAWGFALATVDAGTRLRFITYSDGRWLETYASIGNPTDHTGIYDGAWHHVMGVFDGRRDINGMVTTSLFIDGVLAHSTSVVATTDVLVGFGASQTGTDLYIGTNAWIVGTPTQNFIGSIDAVRITNSTYICVDANTQIYKYPVTRSGVARVTLSGSGTILFTMTVRNEQNIAVKEITESLSLPVTKWLSLGELENSSNYTVNIVVRDAANNILHEDTIAFTMPARPEWADANVINADGEVLEPWTPVEVNASALSCWGRTYDLGNSLLPTSIVSAGNSVLSNRMNIVIGSGSNTYVFNSTNEPKTIILSETGDKVAFMAIATSSVCDVNVEGSLEFDGFMTINLMVLPKAPLNACKLEIPLTNSVAKYIQPLLPNPTSSDWAGTIPSSGVNLNLPLYSSYFGHQSLWICNDDVGLSLLLPPEPDWKSEGVSNIEVIRRGSDTLLRLNFYKSTTSFNEKKVYRFYIQATPIRPYNQDWFKNGSRIAHGIEPGDNVTALEPDAAKIMPIGQVAGQSTGMFEIILQNKTDLQSMLNLDYGAWWSPAADEHILKIDNVDIGVGGGYTWIAGHTGNGLYSSIANNGAYLKTLINPQDFSYQAKVEVWIKPDRVDSDGSQIISLLNGFGLAFVDGKTHLRFIVCNDGVYRDVLADSLSLFDGNWHHVVGTYDGIPDLTGKIHLYLYIDGNLAASNAYDSSTAVSLGSMGETGKELYIGTNAALPHDGTQNYFGAIDEVRICNTLVSGDSNSVGYWHMDEGNGRIAADSSGHGHDFTAGNEKIEIFFDKDRNAISLRATPFVSWSTPIGLANNCLWEPNEIHKITFTWGDKLRFYVDGQYQGLANMSGLSMPNAELKLGSVSGRYVMKSMRISKAVNLGSLSDTNEMVANSNTLYIDNNDLDLHSSARTPLNIAKDMGVKTLFLHEYWNDVQNGGQSKYELILKNLVEDCHRVGLKIIFYFGFEIADLPVNQDIIDECKAMVDATPSYYGPANQYTYIVSYGGPYQEYLLYHMKRLKDSIGIDGVYLDGSLMMMRSDNPAFGAGVTDLNGTRHPIVPIERIRQFAKCVNKLFVQNGGIVEAHMGPGPAVPTMGFATNTYYGEHIGFVSTPWNSVTDLVPLDVSRAIYTGKNTGVPMSVMMPNMLNHLQSFVPDWYEKASAWSDLHRCFFQVMMGRYLNEESINENIKRTILAKFGADSAQWIPYWEADSLVGHSTSSLKASIYRRPDKAMVCAIMNISGNNIVDGYIDFAGSSLSLKTGSVCKELVTGRPISMTGEKVFVTVPAYEGLMVLIDTPYLQGDINQDGKVQMQDLAIFANYWLSDCLYSAVFCQGADINNDGKVDYDDMVVLASQWLSE
ncbi:MAG: glycoside hydrolase domain-containing protein [Sedimentisphaerales bacterium]